MKLAIIGSRTLRGSEVKTIIDFVIKNAKNPIDTIVSGGANGVDAQAECYAKMHGIATKIYLPDYAAHGKRAPLIRNLKIIEECDALLAIWDGKSAGTAYTIRKAREAGKKVMVVQIDPQKNYIGVWPETRGRLPKQKRALLR